MISIICGKVFDIFENKVTFLTSSGVGYLVFCTKSLLQNIAENNTKEAQITAHIQTIVKEDEISLYGFYSTQERDWFNKFLNIQGVGAKMALLILNSLEFDEILNSLAAQDHSVFQKISGIGPKLARRLVNEMNVKNLPTSPIAANPKSFDNTIMLDAESALISLGFSKQDVKSVLDKAPKSQDIQNLEDLIKYSLGALTQKN